MSWLDLQEALKGSKDVKNVSNLIINGQQFIIWVAALRPLTEVYPMRFTYNVVRLSIFVMRFSHSPKACTEI
jgi:hypothetical protein